MRLCAFIAQGALPEAPHPRDRPHRHAYSDSHAVLTRGHPSAQWAIRSGWRSAALRGGEMAEADAWLEELSYENCMGLLRQGVVGRIAVVVDQFPVVLPVNYRLVETSGPTW